MSRYALNCRPRSKQSGVAIVTALLLTTLAITIVTSLFWQQQVQVRSIENQRMQLQKKWIMRGAIDWSRLILREDARHSGKVDHLGEPWSVKLEETRLDQYVEEGRDADNSDATLSGQIVDAQAAYNLNNLASAGVVNIAEVAVFGRLLQNLQLPADGAAAAAQAVAATQSKAAAVNTTVAASGTAQTATTTASASSADSASTAVQFVPFARIEDLLVVPGFNTEMLEKLRPYVTVLPRRSSLTTVNLNTAPAELLSARIIGLSMGDAALLLASRETAYFKDFADFQNRFSEKSKQITSKEVDVWTSYFVVNGKVKMQRSTLDVSALVERAGDGTTTVLAVREN
ncbi:MULTISPECIES: type II secretion system minor pseudopilin GspK [unclassified Undibacterium]|uniref:type II secretion system minor pseudopilin GspK n=1 Tax=unclassified Undibacterium TaxID=2630295 RepID=UPI002AC9B14C|nr:MULTISPECIES: type II secretion system minor pseudopilin GspK [unclassified Undibacterium]MEB0138341.1 type II secretion system minor pseudopilin GspK [Undibacterium sp. CCC2.1]MEB0172718.1 type II secretion system minor pseudopilin GspK [Undibacterium sp. CCC1.1]MEB0174716.1 type II secretion system minor pseudopilin GspK [Undibacterium sp. CCC3.4]MEB0213913.1 type II secretion system minor pseudopilin GspK [Undibacterium sp. 5I2]WPX42637.1 type II secretion system minor pseudopilin GspK [